MKPSPIFAGLNVETAYASPGDLNFLPDTWPPNPDFPICLAADGLVTARYGDDEWDLSPWAGHIMKLNFGKSKRKNSGYINPENSAIFKLVVAFWLFGPKPCKEIRTLKNQYENIKQVFLHCTKNGIKATELYKYPKVIESLSTSLWPSLSNRLTILLHNLWDNRGAAGFYILDASGIAKLQAFIPAHEKSQTAYIPPRIWLYQINRLKTFLDEFTFHQDSLLACAEYCLEAYAHNAGGLEAACSTQLPRNLKPFSSDPNRTNRSSKLNRLGDFSLTAEKFGILELLEKWCGDIRHLSVASLSQYFSMATRIGKAYILNFTLMRIDEAFSLRSDCLKIERDKITNEDIYLLKGGTTKTVDDDEAYWITAPSSEIAVKVMALVSRFRTKCASYNRNINLSTEDIANPYLEVRPYEPWRRQARHDTNLEIRANEIPYNTFTDRHPTLFDEKELRIQESDLAGALLVTPTLDPAKFKLGSPWPLAWHQLRRTGAVNMSASGMVGDASIQYQLKHASRSMTRYYGSGFYHLEAGLNQEARAEYVRTMYEMIARNFLSFTSPDFVSPHGSKRKEQIVNFISSNDHKKLVNAAKSGSIVYREILLGACANTNPCPYGGIDYVGRCGGGDGSPACLDLLIDKTKKPTILKLKSILLKRLKEADKDTPLYESIKFQLAATENTLNVIQAS
ncbi:hypothetical protein NG726_04310 [Pseudomonas sp. MOB-449]|nr:hypothetical protein [Pseudomonas sp. MOB-449]